MRAEDAGVPRDLLRPRRALRFRGKREHRARLCIRDIRGVYSNGSEGKVAGGDSARGSRGPLLSETRVSTPAREYTSLNANVDAPVTGRSGGCKYIGAGAFFWRDLKTEGAEPERKVI